MTEALQLALAGLVDAAANRRRRFTGAAVGEVDRSFLDSRDGFERLGDLARALLDKATLANAGDQQQGAAAEEGRRLHACCCTLCRIA